MFLARIEGRAISSVKHPAFAGYTLLLGRRLDQKGSPEGYPLLLVDRMGAGAGDLVMITTDGSMPQEISNDKRSPIRMSVAALVDE